jgi:hypothetical protein
VRFRFGKVSTIGDGDTVHRLVRSWLIFVVHRLRYRVVLDESVGDATTPSVPLRLILPMHRPKCTREHRMSGASAIHHQECSVLHIMKMSQLARPPRASEVVPVQQRLAGDGKYRQHQQRFCRPADIKNENKIIPNTT